MLINMNRFCIVAYVSLLICAISSCQSASGTESQWNSISPENTIINLTLSSGAEINGVKYRREKLGNKWLLQIKGVSGTKVISGGKTNKLSYTEFDEMLKKLVSLIDERNDGNLDRIHLGWDIVDLPGNNFEKSLRNSSIPNNYLIKPKDPELRNIVTSYLMGTQISSLACEAVKYIRKYCKGNFVSINPIVLGDDYIGREWGEVSRTLRAEIEVNDIWYSIKLD